MAVNRLVVKYGGGFMVREDAADIALNGALEAALTLDTADAIEAAATADALLTGLVSTPEPVITVGIEPSSPADEPYQGFYVGDTVLVDTPDATTEQRRVVSVTVSEDELGSPIYVPELNRQAVPPEGQLVSLLRALGDKATIADPVKADRAVGGETSPARAQSFGGLGTSPSAPSVTMGETGFGVGGRVAQAAAEGAPEHRRFAHLRWAGVPATTVLACGSGNLDFDTDQAQATIWWTDEEVHAVLTFRLVADSGGKWLLQDGSAADDDEVRLILGNWSHPEVPENPFAGCDGWQLEPDDTAGVPMGMVFDGSNQYPLWGERDGDVITLTYYDPGALAFQQVRYDSPAPNAEWYFHFEFVYPKSPMDGNYTGSMVEVYDVSGDYFSETPQ